MTFFLLEEAERLQKASQTLQPSMKYLVCGEAEVEARDRIPHLCWRFTAAVVAWLIMLAT